jgi:hypothetical protein
LGSSASVPVGAPYVIVDVVSTGRSEATRRCPQFEQNFDPSGFWCPHSVQYAIRLLLAR